MWSDSVRKCPHKDLDRTDVSYPYRNNLKEEVQAAVEAARLEHLDAQGRVKPRHQTKVQKNTQYNI